MSWFDTLYVLDILHCVYCLPSIVTYVCLYFYLWGVLIVDRTLRISSRRISALIDTSCADSALESSSLLSGSNSSMEVSCMLVMSPKVELACNMEDLFIVNNFLYCREGLVGGYTHSMMVLVSLERLLHMLRSSLLSYDYLSLGNLVLFGSLVYCVGCWPVLYQLKNLFHMECRHCYGCHCSGLYDFSLM